LLWCAGISSANEVISPPQHPFGPTVLPSKSYSEVYKLSALFDDRTFVQVQMMITNVGLGDSNAACELLVLRPGEKPSKTCRRYNKTRWNFSAAPYPTLSIGPSRLSKEGESARCLIAFDSIVAEISIDKPAGFGQSPDTVVADKALKKLYVNEVLVPWTRLSTALRMPGIPKKQLNGYGMIERSRSVGYPKDFSNGWISFYGSTAAAAGGTQFLAECHFPASKAPGAIGWTWNDRDHVPKPLSGLQMVMKRKADGAHETALPILTEPHSALVISGEQSLFRYSIVDELGPMLGSVVRLIIGNPVTRYYRARALISAGREPADGILEIMNFE
jgi:hypothetical protein